MDTGTYRLKEIDYKLLEFCKEPRTSREIAEHLHVLLKTTQWRLAKLKSCGLVESTITPRLGGHTHLYKTIRMDVIPEKVTTYKPIGMCVMGVWM